MGVIAFLIYTESNGRTLRIHHHLLCVNLSVFLKNNNKQKYIKTKDMSFGSWIRLFFHSSKNIY